MDHKKRYGRFTSSQIFRLMGTPAVKKTYLEETLMERKLGKTLDTDFWSKATSWGYLMEIVAFNELGMEYEMTTKETLLHPILGEYWSGTPDYLTKFKAAEVKGYEFKKWCKLTDALLAKDIPALKKINKGKEYWQVASNAVIAKKPKAELITKMPYESEFETIREFVATMDPNKSPWLAELYESVKWVQFTDKSKVCLLPDGGTYKSLNRFEFTVPMEDIKLLNSTVRENIIHLQDVPLV